MTPCNNSHIKIDWLLIALYTTLVFLGWLSIYSVTGTDTFESLLNFETPHGKQLIFILLGIVLTILIFALDGKFFQAYSGIFYIIGIILLLGLFVFGKNINGQTNWYVFGGFSLQPSEIAKIGTALAITSLVEDNLFNPKKLTDIRNACLLILTPVVIIVLQKDVGSALVFLSLIFVLIRRGLPIKLLVIISIATVLFMFTLKIGLMWSLITFLGLYLIIIGMIQRRQTLFLTRHFIEVSIILLSITGTIVGSKYLYEHILQPHHQDRLKLWLKIENDPHKISILKKTYGYNNDQSIKTIASGGFVGKGILQGDRTNGNFVPAQSTDYIFSVIGEETGFVGSAVVILLFMTLILRIVYKAEHQKTNFAKYYGYAVASILFAHFFVNVGMVLDLLPTVGIPLPFFSYGGSSLWGFTILLFIFIKLDAGKIDDF